MTRCVTAALPIGAALMARASRSARRVVERLDRRGAHGSSVLLPRQAGEKVPKADEGVTQLRVVRPPAYLRAAGRTRGRPAAHTTRSAVVLIRAPTGETPRESGASRSARRRDARDSSATRRSALHPPTLTFR